GHAEISGPGSARIRPVRTAMELAQGVDDVHERVALAANDAALELGPAFDHRLKKAVQVASRNLPTAWRRAEHRRESDRMKVHAEEIVDAVAQVDIAGCHGRTHRHLHFPLRDE